MSETNFSISYKWPATDSWEIDVKDLAWSLFSLWELIDVINKNINWKESQISLRVKAFSKWSFVSDLSLLQVITDATIITACINAQDLLNLVFWEYWLIYFWKMIKGQTIVKSEDSSNWNVDITLADQSVISNMPKRIFNLFGKVSITNNITNIVAPLSKEWIDEIKVIREWEEINSIAKQEYLESMTKLDAETGIEEEIWETESIMFLSFDVIVLESNSKWKFMHWDQKIVADITDPIFLWSVQNKSLAFKSGDFIKARVKIKTTRWVNNVLKNIYTIEEVLEFNSSPFQPWLFTK